MLIEYSGSDSIESKFYKLERMCELIEAANSMPFKAPAHLQELKSVSQIIKENLEKANQNFKAGNGFLQLT